MPIFRQIYTNFWTDPKIQEEFSVEDKLFYIYLLTNPHTTQIGIYTITKKQIAFEIGWTLESTNAVMDRFINHHQLISYNSETREIAIKNWAKYNLNRAGTPMENCVRKELREIKDKSLLMLIYEHIENKKFKQIFEEYFDELRNGVRNETRDEGNNNNNNNNNNNKKVTVVVDKIKKYFDLESKDIEKIVDVFIHTNKGIDYLEEKLRLVKNTESVKSVTGYLITALEKNYKPIPSRKNKTKFHNFNETFGQYTDEELKNMANRGQLEESKFG
nr:MAG TPA: Replication initiation and membrane attachment [Bacteriophage sp.]